MTQIVNTEFVYIPIFSSIKKNSCVCKQNTPTLNAMILIGKMNVHDPDQQKQNKNAETAN